MTSVCIAGSALPFNVQSTRDYCQIPLRLRGRWSGLSGPSSSRSRPPTSGGHLRQGPLRHLPERLAKLRSLACVHPHLASPLVIGQARNRVASVDVYAGGHSVSSSNRKRSSSSSFDRSLNPSSSEPITTSANVCFCFCRSRIFSSMVPFEMRR